MRKIIQISLFFCVFFCATSFSFGQQNTNTDPDIRIKESLYSKYRKEVLAFNKRDFDNLFFEFFEKQNSEVTLTKQEFYTYTIKIAIYSEKLGLLYKNQKEEANKTKQEWFDRSYSDYLKTKQ